jgi:SAM-dependent methyltransferase
MTPPLPPENQYGHTKKLRFLIDAIARHRAALGRPVTVLDFGCGNGSAVSQYLMGEGVRYYGVDIHPDSLAHARARYGGPDAAFLQRVPEDATFDVIVYADVLEHLDDPAATLRAHRAQLAPNGIVVGAVPNGYGPFEIEQKLDRWFGLSHLLAGLSTLVRLMRGHPAPEAAVLLPYNHESGHVMFFTRTRLLRTVAAAGFDLVWFGHGAFMGASVSGVLLGRSARLLRWNVAVADRLPYRAVATWYFVLRQRGGG